MSVVEYVHQPDIPGVLALLYRACTSRSSPFYYMIQTPVVFLHLLAGYVTEDTYLVFYTWISFFVAVWKVCEMFFGMPVCFIVVCFLRLCDMEISDYLLRMLLVFSTLFGTSVVIYFAANEK